MIKPKPYERTSQKFLEGYYTSIWDLPYNENECIEWKKGYLTMEEELANISLEEIKNELF